MSFNSPIPHRRPPPPRPPKSQYLLDQEAELRLSKQAAPRPAPIAYPKGINPFGESSDEDEPNESVSQPINSLPPPPSNVGANPFDDFPSSEENDQVKPNDSTNPEVLVTSLDDSDVQEIVTSENEVALDDPIESISISPVKSEIIDDGHSPPATNPFDGFPDNEDDGEIEAKPIDVDSMNTPIDKSEASQQAFLSAPAPPLPTSSNPFDGFSDEEEQQDIDNSKTDITVPDIPQVPQIPPKPPRKRPAPKPPQFGSTDGLSRDQSMRLSLQAVNEASASPQPIRSALSMSTESVHRPKGRPAPPLPVGQKREIRAEGFVKYPKLRREIEETNGKLSQIDEEIAALRTKMEQCKSMDIFPVII